VTLALWGSRTQGAPTVWNLNDFVEGAEPQAPSPPPVPMVGQTFVPIHEAPAHTGLFRP
jgi:hypothetical protein